MPGQAGAWNLQTIARWLARHRKQKASAALNGHATPDTGIARVRALKAETMELALRKQRGELVPVQEFQQFSARGYTVMRRAMDKLRQCPSGCHGVMDEALTEAQREILSDAK